LSEETVQFVSAPDGTKVAFTIAGSGPPLVLTNGLTTTSFFWKYLRPRWLERHTVLTWDYPGHGRSEPARSAQSMTIEAQPEIMVRVMEAAGLATATQIGFSVGCQVVLELARQHVERCSALVLLFGSFEHALRSTVLPVPGGLLHVGLRTSGGAAFAKLVQELAQVARFAPTLGPLKQLGMIGRGLTVEDARQLVSDLRRVHSPTVAALAASAELHSARDLLPHLRLPLLVVAGDRDRFAPPDKVAVPLHRAVPQSVLVRIREGTHTALLDCADEVANVVDGFLQTESKVRGP
jgi:pimeloyl-ACP methyl ester carboxylesterase